MNTDTRDRLWNALLFVLVVGLMTWAIFDGAGCVAETIQQQPLQSDGFPAPPK